MWETWVRSLGWEDPLEESMATHSNILAWRIPMDRGAWRATVHGVAKSWVQMSWTQMNTAHGDPIFSFGGTPMLFSIVILPIYIPINSVGGFPFLHTLSSICYL